VLFVSFSGKTAELKTVKHHLAPGPVVIAMTAHQDASTCPLLVDRAGAILLPAPIPESEESSFGVGAPTTSTTVAMAVSDMLALTVADILHQGQSAAFFRKHHPGGTIGGTIGETNP
jgi:D-arabinose 5-phosphate isomerase GutQ